MTPSLSDETHTPATAHSSSPDTNTTLADVTTNTPSASGPSEEPHSSQITLGTSESSVTTDTASSSTLSGETPTSSVGTTRTLSDVTMSTPMTPSLSDETHTPATAHSSSPDTNTTLADVTTNTPSANAPSVEPHSSQITLGTTESSVTTDTASSSTLSGETSTSSVGTTSTLSDVTTSTAITSFSSRETTSLATTQSLSAHASTSPSIASTIVTTTELCYNGGTFDGIKCICNEDLFYGPKCEFLVDEIPVRELSVTIIVEAQVRVTNREYNKSLENLSSAYSLEIQDQFRKQMKIIYRAVPGYQGVEILQMRNGSVIVVHKVISQVSVQNNWQMIQKQMENITVSVNNSLKDIHAEGDCSKLSDPELCFVPLPNSILDTTVFYSPEENCKRHAGNSSYADYYYPQIIAGTLRCVSRCVKGTQFSMNCFSGVCRLSEIGPQCICNNLDLFWYLDSYCQLRVQKSAVGLGLALAVLFVVSIILIIILIRAKQKKYGTSSSADADIWYGQDADEEWIPSGDLNIMNKAAVSSWDKHQDRDKMFNLSLDSVDTSVQLHFQKPVITTDC
ncbi:mucin-3A-like [Liasis olivaceus]